MNIFNIYVNILLLEDIIPINVLCIFKCFNININNDSYEAYM